MSPKKISLTIDTVETDTVEELKYKVLRFYHHAFKGLNEMRNLRSEIKELKNKLIEAYKEISDLKLEIVELKNKLSRKKKKFSDEEASIIKNDPLSVRKKAKKYKSAPRLIQQINKGTYIKIKK